MKTTLPILLIVALSAGLSLRSKAQGAPDRDPQVVSLVARSVAAMGAGTPNDSVATGNGVLFAGGDEEPYSLRILTRGLHEYREERQSGDGEVVLTFSHVRASARDGGVLTRLSGENAVNDYCPYFPLAGVLADFNNPDVSIEYVGLETAEGRSLHHIRLWNTFGSVPEHAPPGVAPNTMADLWIDAETLLPKRLAYNVYAQGAPQEPVPVELTYESYGNFGGTLYPTRITKHFNGTLYAQIEIQQVQFNVGLTDADFAVD